MFLRVDILVKVVLCYKNPINIIYRYANYDLSIMCILIVQAAALRKEQIDAKIACISEAGRRVPGLLLDSLLHLGFSEFNVAGLENQDTASIPSSNLDISDAQVREAVPIISLIPHCA